MIPYIINVAIILAGCLVFYKLLLQKETFYRINRWVLIICLVISFGLPLLPVPQQWSLRKAENTEYIDMPGVSPVDPAHNSSVQPGVEESTTTASDNSTQKTSNTGVAVVSNKFSLNKMLTWLFYLYWFGVLAFALSFLVQVIILLVRAYRAPVIIDGKFRIVEITGNKAPCSFGNNIFINPEKYDYETYEQIINHEKIHIRQKHTLDILLAEFVLIFQWFNPFAWLYRKEIETNLEYLTDNDMVQKQQVEPTSYQLSLLKVSTPHFPMSLTTNYNQSLLKKRIAMMNAKRSNVHTAWKYLFLLPLLALFACLFNDPVANAQPGNERRITREGTDEKNNIDTEGSWFATIKGDKVKISFQNGEDEKISLSSSDFKLSDLGTLPRNSVGTFKITRDAGTLELTGKFEGDQGMGRYKFVADKNFASFMKSEGFNDVDENDQMVYFFVNVTKDYVSMLKKEGFISLDSHDLIPLAALNINREFIQSIKTAGYANISPEDLIPLKSLGVTSEYIKEIKAAGYPNVSLSQLITLKAQGIDKDYITRMKKDGPVDLEPTMKEKKEKKTKDKDADEEYDAEMDHLVTFKALNITEEFVQSFKALGYDKISKGDIISLKAVGVTPEFIREFQQAGFRDLAIEEYVPLKSLSVTPAFIKSFEPLGFKNLTAEDGISLKSLGVTPEYIKEMKAKGFNYSNIQKYITLKTVGLDD